MFARLGIIATCFSTLLLVEAAQAQTYTASQLQAKRMLEKISGTKIPMDNPLIAQMAAKIDANDSLGAATLATTHPNFLNITVKQMALKMSTRDETMRLPLNDFAAAFMGVTRDGVDARTLLSGNFYYMADPTKIPTGTTVPANLVADFALSNNHYQALDNLTLDIGSVLMPVTSGQPMASQGDPTKATLIINPEPAGVLTSRTFMLAHAEAGTNRRLVNYTFREFMCTPMAGWADTQVSDMRIGRDVDRFPGSDNNKFLTSCKGCHAGMDAFRGAFAKWDVDNGANLVSHSGLNNGGSFDGNGVATKMNKNNTVFPDGFTTINDSFINNAQGTANALTLGWRPSTAGPNSGNGAAQFGTLIANSSRFSQCMGQRVYEATCRKTMDTTAQLQLMINLGTYLESKSYNLKSLFQYVATLPDCY